MNKTIILADDNPGHIRLIETNLRRSGFEDDIFVASNGRDVLNKIEAIPVEEYKNVVIILDLNMPLLSGIKVLTELKSDSVTSRIIIIVLTTTDNPTEIERCYSLHANWCVTKSVDYSQFKKTIQSIGEFIVNTV